MTRYMSSGQTIKPVYETKEDNDDCEASNTTLLDLTL